MHERENCDDLLKRLSGNTFAYNEKGNLHV